MVVITYREIPPIGNTQPTALGSSSTIHSQESFHGLSMVLCKLQDVISTSGPSYLALLPAL